MSSFQRPFQECFSYYEFLRAMALLKAVPMTILTKATTEARPLHVPLS